MAVSVDAEFIGAVPSHLDGTEGERAPHRSRCAAVGELAQGRAIGLDPLMLRRTVLGWGLAAVMGCAPRSKSASGKSGSDNLSLAEAKPTIPTLLVAKKIPRTLYIVLDPTRVPDDVDMSVSHPLFKREIHVGDFRLFVERDLKMALEPYFEKVVVVRTSAAIPDVPHIVADVKVDKVHTGAKQGGMSLYLPQEITWSFALRPSEESNYLFSYAGTSANSGQYPSFIEGLAEMIEVAITGMLKKWTEDDGIEKLRNYQAPQPGTSPDTKTKNGDLKSL